MSKGTETPSATALDEVRRLCAPYVGTLLANGDAATASELRSHLQAVSLDLRKEEDPSQALHRQLTAANRQVEALTKQVRDLSLRLMAANGELRQEVERADRAESALRAQSVPPPRFYEAGVTSGQ